MTGNIRSLGEMDILGRITIQNPFKFVPAVPEANKLDTPSDAAHEPTIATASASRAAAAASDELPISQHGVNLYSSPTVVNAKRQAFLAFAHLGLEGTVSADGQQRKDAASSATVIEFMSMTPGTSSRLTVRLAYTCGQYLSRKRSL
jgi:hypothetical protein